MDSLTSFIANNSFKEENDLVKMDILWQKSLELNDHDNSEALFDLIFACIPYKNIHLRVPVTGGILTYNILSSNDSIFNLKNKNLPKYLFFDSERTDYGDKDKPAHFFGTAFLAYNENFFDLSNTFGYFVEAFEERFELQNKIDARDLRANFYGSLFGKALRTNKNAKPSTFFLLHTLSYIRITI
ncbi:MAG: hypothetical protein Q8903_08910 [Bacteroidota bacterium]|nr:hypothetical protein [Bacteroidota bacterium]